MRDATVVPAEAFRGNGRQRAYPTEIAALKKEVGALGAKRDVPKKQALLASRGKQNNDATWGVEGALFADRPM